MCNHRKVLVYSYYRDVIDAVRAELGDRVFGVITGSTSPDERQRLVDRLTESREPGVLISQIVAGGVGLNMQAASVVILCEPQVKPSLESQAIARAHRMGQVQAVQVHRLLTTDSVDERMLEILARKSALFEQLAGRSEVAETSVDAKDITEAALAMQVLEREATRLAAELRERIATRPAEEAADRSTSEGEDERRDEVATRLPEAPARPASEPPPAIPARRRQPPPTSRISTPWPNQTQPETTICGACDKPIDALSHCGCS